MFYSEGSLMLLGLTDLLFRHSNFNTPDADGLDVRAFGKEWFCAYKSLEQFKLWVRTSEIKTLIARGFDILLLDVEEFQVGNDQVVFTKQSITSTKVINELFL